MSDRSKIEWTDATWNPILARNRANGKLGWFCTHMSEGCRGCYAEGMNARLGTGVAHKAQNVELVEVYLDDDVLAQPLRWRKPRAVFPCSMTDLFGEFVTDAMVANTRLIMAYASQHTFIVLTKRSMRMRRYLEGAPALPNVWLGVSVEDRATLRRVTDLIATPAARRLVSAEPLLEAVDFTRVPIPDETGRTDWRGPVPTHSALHASRYGPALDWIIVGGESGRSARPMHPAWARAVRDQCAAAGVAFFFKQWGEWAAAVDDDVHVFRDLLLAPDGSISGGTSPQASGSGVWMRRLGKRDAGRLLDGVEHNARPDA